jgi:hypothetical protein
MNLDLKRLFLASARLKILTQIDTSLREQFLELMELRQRVQNETRA